MDKRISIKKEPKLFDKVIGILQQHIASNISWLDHIYGLCEMQTEIKDGRKSRIAGLYKGKERYELIMPCNELGNFCFFMLKDPQEIDRNNPDRVNAPFYAIFWYNMKDVSSYVDERNREAVKDEILAVLNSLHAPFVKWDRIYERPEAVFNDFTYDETQNQFLMSPYAGFRIDGTISANVSCLKSLRVCDFNEDFNNDFDNCQ